MYRLLSLATGCRRFLVIDKRFSDFPSYERRPGRPRRTGRSYAHGVHEALRMTVLALSPPSLPPELRAKPESQTRFSLSGPDSLPPEWNGDILQPETRFAGVPTSRCND